MRIRVLYFAAVRDIAGLDEELLELPRHVTTVGDFAKHLAMRHPALASRLDHLRVAKNEQFAKAEEALHEDDVLALIPPVAGG